MADEEEVRSLAELEDKQSDELTSLEDELRSLDEDDNAPDELLLTSQASDDEE